MRSDVKRLLGGVVWTFQGKEHQDYRFGSVCIDIQCRREGEKVLDMEYYIGSGCGLLT